MTQNTSIRYPGIAISNLDLEIVTDVIESWSLGGVSLGIKVLRNNSLEMLLETIIGRILIFRPGSQNETPVTGRDLNALEIIC
ncbi:hypothetical protein TNCV_2052861 [Trichonephila clavipes]|nr:hypothetical protein TNCV_2052861 [Trichonephila clavipes]